MLFSFDDAEPAVMGDLPLFVLCSVNIMDGDWSSQFLASYPKSFPGIFVDEVVSGATIYEGGFVGLGLRSAKRNIHIQSREFPNVHRILQSRCSQPDRRLRAS
jgi:hypothetical protein